MINLLPPDVKAEISYARRNAKLVGWVVALTAVIAGVGFMTAFGVFYIQKNISNQQKVAKIAEERMVSQNVEKTKSELQSLSNNVNTIVQILNKQLLFSKMFTAIGGVLPRGTALNDITLSSAESALDLNIGASSRETATQAFVNISDPKNGFFDKADLITINCSEGTDKKYPCTATIRVTLKTDSSFYFLNSVTGAKQ